MKDIRRKWGIPVEALQGGPEFTLYPVPEALAAKPALTFDLLEKLLPYRNLIEENYDWPDGKYLNITGNCTVSSNIIWLFSFSNLARGCK